MLEPILSVTVILMAGDKISESGDDKLKVTGSNNLVEDLFAAKERKGDAARISALPTSLAGDTSVSKIQDSPPTKLPADGVKPEPDAPARGLQKVVPDNAGTAPRETQASRDGVTPTSHPGDKALVPPANPGANPKVSPEVTPKAGEQQRASTDGVPRVQNLVENPTTQRPVDVVLAQPVSNSVKAPERAPEKLSPSPTEQQSDRALLPGLAIVGPEGKAQQGSVATVGTSDGKVHDPVLSKPQEAAGAKANDLATPKPEVLGVKANDASIPTENWLKAIPRVVLVFFVVCPTSNILSLFADVRMHCMIRRTSPF